MEKKMRLFKVMSALLLLLVIGSTLKQHGAMLAPIVPNPENQEFLLEFPFACRVEATEEVKEYPAISLGNAQLDCEEASARLTVTTEESGSSMVWLKLTAKNRHELKGIFFPYIIIMATLSLLMLVFSILILVSACKVLWNFARERIFTQKQSKRLTRLGIYLLIAGVLNNAFVLFSHYYIASHVSFEGWTFIMPNLLLGNFIVALLILLFNEILKHSILLKEEQSLTI